MDWTIDWGYPEMGNYTIPDNPDSPQYLTGNQRISDFLFKEIKIRYIVPSYELHFIKKNNLSIPFNL